MTEQRLFEAAPVPTRAPTGAVEAWSATDYSRGPWDHQHCHGGPVAALLARACERAPVDDGDWLIARLTIELTRPVPVGTALALTSATERAGRKVSLVAASLWDEDTEVAKVRALRIRRREFALPEHPLQEAEIEGVPGAGRSERVSWATSDDVTAFHSHSVEHRVIDGSWNDPGPVAVWIRLQVDVVDGEQPSGVQRTAAVADFGNGVGSGIDYDAYVFINPDLTVHLAREPRGEWIGLASHSRYGTATASSGAGFAESALYDDAGRLGRSVQSLFVEPR